MAKRDADKTAKKQQVGVPFKPGQSGNPAGRPKGARSRLSEAFLTALEEHWKDNGKDALVEALKKDPAGYVRVVASLLPKDVNLDVSDDLAAVLNAIDGKTRGVPGTDSD